MIPSISSWVKIIQAFKQIIKKLHGVKLGFSLVRNFNQDPLANLFGAIRSNRNKVILWQAKKIGY